MLLEREVTVDSKRRATIPTDLLREAGVRVGDHLVVTVVGPGSFALRTRASILSEVRAEIEAGFSDGIVGSTDAIDEIRAERQRDSGMTDARLDVDEPRDPEVVQARGTALLTRLGL